MPRLIRHNLLPRINNETSELVINSDVTSNNSLFTNNITAQVLKLNDELQVTGGSVSEPCISFIEDADTGIYYGGTNTLNITCGNDLTASFGPDDVYIYETLRVSSGHGLYVDGSIRTYNRLYIYQSTGSIDDWSIDMDNLYNLDFDYNGTTRGYLRYDVSVSYLDFTGQHRSKHTETIDITKHKGLIVSSTGNYNNLTGSNLNIPTINESLPEVELSSIPNDKKVYGVLSDKEDENSTKREYELGAFVSVFEKEIGDSRLIINAIGEGGIWVCDINGNIENGDYITSSSVKGYGMKQNDDILHNYTVAKITCDCDFSNINVNFEKRYLNSSGEIITEEQYNSNVSNNISSYKAAFVGCTYHCG